MMLFTFRLRPGGDGSGVADLDMLSRSIQVWAGLVGSEVEHVSTRFGPDGLYLGLFYRSGSGGLARRDAHRICRELLSLHSELDGWDADEWNAA